MAAPAARVSMAPRAQTARVLATAAPMARLVAMAAVAQPEARAVLLVSVAVRVPRQARPVPMATAAMAAWLAMAVTVALG